MVVGPPEGEELMKDRPHHAPRKMLSLCCATSTEQTYSGELLQHDTFDLIKAVVEFRRVWAFMGGDDLGVLHRAAIFEISCDACRSHRMAADGSWL